MLISLESGRAFADFGGVELSDWIGHKITIRDSANKELIGYIKAAGTGETYGSELLNNPDFENASGLWVEDATAASVLGGETGRCLRIVSNGVNTQFSAGESEVCVNGALLKSSVYVKVGTEGRLIVSLTLDEGDFHTWAILFNADGPVNWTLGSAYGVADSTNFAMAYGGYVDPPAVGEIRYFDTASVKQVLTPSVTGVTIVSSVDGSTYNWVSEESGFNRNDYSGYTYEIEIVSASISPSLSPSLSPSVSPSESPSASISPSISPSLSPSISPSASQSLSPSFSPSISLSISPSYSISLSPSVSLSLSPSASQPPSFSPSISPSLSPSVSPSMPTHFNFHGHQHGHSPTMIVSVKPTYLDKMRLKSGAKWRYRERKK